MSLFTVYISVHYFLEKKDKNYKLPDITAGTVLVISISIYDWMHR